MDATSTPTSALKPLSFPSGTEVYDQIMGEIDSDLLSTNIQHLDDAYQNESEEDRVKRYERYTAAFTMYDEAYAAWQTAFAAQVNTYRRDVLRFAEQRSNDEEAGELVQLEQDIGSDLSTSV